MRTDQGEPTVSDRYELRKVLGSGGMGTVWEAYDRRLDRTVALKVLRDDLPPSAQAQLEREARAAARISDPRVVTVLDLDRTRDGSPYLVLECHDGVTLADLLRDGALDAERLDHLVDDLLGALAAAHERGVLHRDVKPANVLASNGGFRVTDFGLASLDDDQTTETDLMGTLVYVAPERLEGARGSTRSDVFSAAVVLYEAATGIQPFRADDPAESISRLRAGDAPGMPDHLPLDLRTTIHRALSADPRQRPADAGEMLALIRGGLEDQADPTIVLDATSVLPPAGPEDPTEDVFARAAGARPDPDATTRAPVGSAPGVPAMAVHPGASVFEPMDAPSPVTERSPAAADDPASPSRPVAAPRTQPPLADRVRPVVEAVRRRPEALIAALAAAVLLGLFLVVAVADGGDPGPAAPAAEQPTSLDGVLDRIEELGR